VTDDPEPKKIPLIFYRTAAGNAPVREWLKALEEVERQTIGSDLLRAQWRWPVGMPLCRPFERRNMGSPYRPADRTDGTAFCSASTASTWWRCTGLSRRRDPRRLKIWRWRESARRI